MVWMIGGLLLFAAALLERRERNRGTRNYTVARATAFIAIALMAFRYFQ